MPTNTPPGQKVDRIFMAIIMVLLLSNTVLMTANWYRISHNRTRIDVLEDIARKITHNTTVPSVDP